LTARVTDAHGLTGQAQVTIRVRADNVAPDLRLLGPADGTSVPAGTTVTFRATATDDFDGDLAGQIHWTSTHDGDLGTGGTRVLVPREGAHVVTATVTDSDGSTSSAHVTLTV